MATQKPISTISYNSEAFLREKLEAWYDAHIIQAYQYICHKGEDGDKDHIHLRVEPNKKLDPMDLADALKEYVRDNDKPLGVRPWRPSKEEDWYLYAVHDADYLSLKYGGGEKGEKLPYDWHDIKASQDYDVEIAFIRARAVLQHSSVSVAKKLQEGSNPLDLVLQGENVYFVNAMARAMFANDYQRLADEYRILSRKLQTLIADAERHGFTVSDKGDEMFLIPVDDVTGEIIDSASAALSPEDENEIPF